jgi:hypothetical protein
VQGKIVRHVPLGNKKRVELCDGVSIPYSIAERILGDHSVRLDFAEKTTGLSQTVALCDATEVAVVAIPLRRIARVAQCLKVRYVLSPTFVARDNMVSLERPIIR